MSLTKSKFTRREFIQIAGGTVGALTLAACTPAPQQASSDDGGAMSMPEVHLWPSIALVRPEGSHPAKYEAVQAHIAEQTGIRPVGQVAPPGDAGTQKLNLLLSSKDERIDLFVGDWPQYKEIVISLNDLLEEHGRNVLAAHDDLNWAGVTDSDGNIWGVPRLGVMGHTWNFPWIRSDWLAELGISPNLDQMTVEGLESIMAAFKEYNPDAVMVTNNLGSLRGCLVGGWTEYGNSNWFDESEGVLKPAELQPGFRDWVAKMNEWWNKDWFHKETFSNMDFEEVLRSGNLGIHCGWYSRITILGQRIILEDVVPGMDFVFPQKLIGPAGISGSNNANMTRAFMIPKKSPDPVSVIKYLNWMYDPDKDNVVTAHFGIQGVDWEWVDPDNKYYVRRLTQMAEGEEIYAGEFYAAAGLGPETWYAPDDDLWRRHYEHIRDYATQYDNGKMPVDFDVPYDIAVIQDRVPGLEDISRLTNEEITKFITGIRPMPEWDAFINQLYQAGMDDWIAAHTEQFLAIHPQ